MSATKAKACLGPYLQGLGATGRLLADRCFGRCWAAEQQLFALRADALTQASLNVISYHVGDLKAIASEWVICSTDEERADRLELIQEVADRCELAIRGWLAYELEHRCNER
ncbi:hypothetical protein [Gloeobacter kilaueensis]|uniref:Uncharacterized protein n=1 Tax=Gloeobacter kilaueensis (strain ATCC BAA-2537 / CCAP 1431/1 / ULC 316 / JS1) TaxID=1183438 RepID=U5QE24_GLOK1|nr:hypothetical protein [Gloeobacter kilaueensis]AGY57123.1 hypothetical protein GKIL_0877 [Gloeobacter kilaueensis JS1]